MTTIISKLSTNHKMIKFSSKLIHISEEEKDYIRKCLPDDWHTDVKEVFVDKDFEIFIRINAKTIDDIQKWISCYQLITETSYSVETTYKCSGQRVIFKRSYHCQHKTRHKHTYDPVYRRSIKNTNCPSIFSVAIRTIKKRYQGKDKSKAPDHNKPCEIRLKLKHNHSTTNSMALKFKKVLPQVKTELIKLFQQGHTAATALQTLKADIRLNYENCQDVLADRSRCPDYSFCHYLYQKSLTENSVEFNNEFLERKLQNYNLEMNETSAKMIISNTGFVICLCPALVRRIHQYQINSSEIVFLDSFSTCDKTNRMFILVTQSESGGLPLGVVITSSNTSLEIKSGLNLLKEMLGEAAFYGNLNGPQIVLSDEHILDNQIVESVWPETKNLLSIFHVLQNIWKWLQSAKNGIAASDRPVLFKDFYNLLYSATESEFLDKFELAKQNSLKYKHYLKHLNNYFDKRHYWALCFRPDLTDSSSTYSEISMRILRDQIFQRIKSFNLIQMVDFILNNYFRYFEKQLIDVAHHKEIQNIFYSKDQLPNDEILNKIQVLGKNARLVPSEKVKDLFYMVNTELLTCTCFNGNTNAICKHIHWVCMLVYTDELAKHIKNIEIRKKCYFIATGCELQSFVETYDSQSVTEELMDDKQTLGDHHGNDELFGEMYVAMESSEIVDIDEYLIMKKKDDCVTECKESLRKITDKIEELLQNEPEELLPALKVIYSRFQVVNNVSDISTVFSILDSGNKVKVLNKNKQLTSTSENPVLHGRITKRRKSKKEELKNVLYLDDINNMLM